VRAPFVGHEQALARARTCLEQAGAGHGSLLLIAGEPGIGKSRLAEEMLAEERGRGWITASGRCYDFEGSPQPKLELRLE
jgi:predicted ATPase